MNQDRREFAGELYAASRIHDEGQSDRLARFRNVEPATAELLGVLVRGSSAVRVLELGTSNGYSTVWLADAVEATGGNLVSVDTDPARISLACQNLRRMALDERVELRVQDAGVALSQSKDSAWDFVFLDAERPHYVDYERDLVRTLAPGGILAVDNVLSHEHELTEFTSLIDAEPALTQTVVPIGAGLRVAVRDSGAS